jgi:hypothetical protein
MTKLHELIHSEIPKLEGWVSPERGCEMADLITKHRPQVCVEIGVFGARSIISQGMALYQNGSGKIYGIDPWRVDAALEGESGENAVWWKDRVDLHGIHKSAMEAIWRIGIDKQVVILRASSQNVVQLFPKIDHLFIDGNHTEVASCRDVTLYVPLVKTGGIVIFDDTDWPSTQKAVAILDKSCELLKDAMKYRIYRKK